VILGGKYTALTEVIRHVTLTEEYSCVLISRSHWYTMNSIDLANVG